ncbi:kinase-like domain-containing protein [Aspergillus varians]
MASFNSGSFDEYRLHAEVRHNPYCVIHSLSDDRLPVALRRPGSEQRWERVKDLGHGSFGIVWLEELRSGTSERNLRAIKSVRKVLMGDMRELSALTDFSRRKHAHTRSFVKFLGWFEDESTIYIAMEYFPHGTLSRYISMGIPENEIRMITGQLLIGLIEMHEEEYAHRDMKPDNIFIETHGPDWSVKIGDFGISKRAKSNVTALRTTTGTPLYEAPEIRGDVPLEDEEERDGYTNAVDMWSLGCVVYEMAAATQLFPRYPFDYKKLCWGRWYPDKPQKLSQQGWDFIKQLLVPNPGGRMSAEEAILHNWITTSDQKLFASEAVEKGPEVVASLPGDNPLRDTRDFELTVTPSHNSRESSNDDSIPHASGQRTTMVRRRSTEVLASRSSDTRGAFPSYQEENRGDSEEDSKWSAGSPVDDPTTTIKKRKTVVIVVSSQSSSYQSSKDLNNNNASILSALPEHVSPETAKVFVLIYAPGLKNDPNEETRRAGEIEGMTPYFKTLYAEGLALVEKETMVMPFSTPSGYVHLVRHISPDVAYIQESLSGPDGSMVYQISSWVRKVVVIVDIGESHSNQIDSDDESLLMNPVNWWLKEGRTGIGHRIDVVDELRVGVDWQSRVSGRD